jgi:hypothetical protein
MRVFFISISAVLAVLTAQVTPAGAASGTLTGKMANSNWLVGSSWSCKTKDVMDGKPARTSHATVTFDAAPGNVLHDRVSSPKFSLDEYSGFDAKSNAYWDVQADNTGSHTYATSPDGNTFTGMLWDGDSSSKTTFTYTKMGSNEVTLHQVSPGETFDADCTR